jgi:hypothetical protein
MEGASGTGSGHIQKQKSFHFHSTVQHPLKSPLQHTHILLCTISVLAVSLPLSAAPLLAILNVTHWTHYNRSTDDLYQNTVWREEQLKAQKLSGNTDTIPILSKTHAFPAGHYHDHAVHLFLIFCMPSVLPPGTTITLQSIFAQCLPCPVCFLPGTSPCSLFLLTTNHALPTSSRALHHVVYFHSLPITTVLFAPWHSTLQSNSVILFNARHVSSQFLSFHCCLHPPSINHASEEFQTFCFTWYIHTHKHFVSCLHTAH